VAGTHLQHRSQVRAQPVYVRFCDAFSIPIGARMGDLPGYLPGTDQEWTRSHPVGWRRRSLRAYAEAAVPHW
jgi:acetyl-CoA carboxylase carboxyltransferase component